MSSRPALGSTPPPIQGVPGDLSPTVKRPEREADHSPPASAEVKKMWILRYVPRCYKHDKYRDSFQLVESYISTPPYAFMA
jgi:hypothetical protein